MDKLEDILRRVAAGEITPDQAEQQINAKPGRGRPKKDKKQVRVAGCIIEINPRRKATRHNMDIGRRYVEMTSANKSSRYALATIQRSERNRKNPLSEDTIFKYAALYRLECWKRELEARHQKEFDKPVNADESVHDMLEVMKAFGIQVDKNMVRIISD